MKQKPMYPTILANCIRNICNSWWDYHYIKTPALDQLEALRDKQAYLQSLDQKDVSCASSNALSQQ